MKSLEHQNVMILGLGISGLAMARWCVQHGASVTIIDSRSHPPQLSQLKAEIPDARFIFSQFQAALLESVEIDYLLISPGIKPGDVSELLECA